MQANLDDQTICFIGAGSMAEAIIRGLIGRAGVRPERIVAVNRMNRERLSELQARYGIRTADEPAAKSLAVREADVVFLAMKPKDVKAALAEIRAAVRPQQLIISVIAGLSIAGLQRLLPDGVPIIRTMPNTSSTIGFGATGLAASEGVSQEQLALAVRMFESVGVVKQVEEALLDVVTGVSGSGPAYVYYLIEAMTAAGAEGGLTPETARELAVQTVLGAAQMVRQTGEDPAELRRKVTSPGGTTQAALELLEREGVGQAVKRAVHRAAERARELGALLEEQA
jgi:pyrroline-5-carboxylate reductase